MTKKSKYILGGIGAIMFSWVCANQVSESPIFGWYITMSAFSAILGSVTIIIAMIEL